MYIGIVCLTGGTFVDYRYTERVRIAIVEDTSCAPLATQNILVLIVGWMDACMHACYISVLERLTFQ